MRKTIGINTLFLVPNDVGGTEYHTRSFLKYLEKLDKKNHYVVFCNKENYSTFEFSSRRWKKVLCPINANNRLIRLLYEQTILPIKISEYSCNIIHSFGYIGPLFTKAKKIVTIHDANWRDHPPDFSFLERTALQFLVEMSIRSANVVVTSSDFGLERLQFHFPDYKHKINLISGGLDDEFKVLLEESKNPNCSLVKQPYILCVSSMYPHKRILYLLDIWEKIVKQDNKLSLVIVGHHGRDEQKVLARIDELIRITHYQKVSFAELIWLYKNATAFVFPSIYEGFGHPVYEALYAKLPCFVGDKSLYTREIQGVLHKLSGNTVVDTKMILKFKKSRRDFVNSPSYKESASKLIDLYNTI